MTLNWKRIALLLGFIATVFIFGYLLYYLFFKPSLPSNQPINTNQPDQTNTGLPSAGTNTNIPVAGNINGSLPGVNTNTNTALGETPRPEEETSPIASGGVTSVTSLTNTTAYQPTLSADGSTVVYYDRTTGKFYTVGSSGKSTPLSDQVFFQAQNIYWSPNKQQAVIEYPDGANILYNFETKKQITLPSHWKEFSFSPTNQQLVFKSMGTDTDNRWLAIANADGSQAKKLEHLGDKDATVYPAWSPNNQVVAMYTEDNDFDKQNLFFVGKNDENFKLMTVDGRGFKGIWSTQGDKLLYSVYSSNNDYKPTLWITETQGDTIGDSKQALKIDTWADRCSFANNDTIYCAVPQTLARGSGMFANELDTAPSDVYRIDLKTGFRSKIAVPDGNYNIEKVFAADNGDYLYFTNKNDGRLYSIRLK